MLRRNKLNNHCEIWDALNGTAVFYGKKKETRKILGCIPIASGYSVDGDGDPTCQLKEVGCVIGEHNIWANIQKNGNPSVIDWDLDNKRYWSPFFGKKNINRLFPEG